MGLVIARNSKKYSTNVAPNYVIATNGWNNLTTRFEYAARYGLLDATGPKYRLPNATAAKNGLTDAKAARNGLFDWENSCGSTYRYDVTVCKLVEFYSYQYHFSCQVSTIISYGFSWNNVVSPWKTMWNWQLHLRSILNMWWKSVFYCLAGLWKSNVYYTCWNHYINLKNSSRI